MLLGLQQTVFICVVSDSTWPNAVLLLSCNKKIKVYVHIMEACKGRRGTAPLLPSLSTRCRVINFTPEKKMRRRLGGLQTWTTCF